MDLREENSRLRAELQALQQLFQQVEKAKKEWERAMDCVSEMVLRIDHEGKIQRCNRALKDFIGQPYLEILQRDWQVMLAEQDLIVPELSHEDFEVRQETTGRWFAFRRTAYKQDVHSDEICGEVVVIHDITDLKKTTIELEQANSELKSAQATLLQQEKLASLGQLAAGVAHEINNPMSFVVGNLEWFSEYVHILKRRLYEYSHLAESLRQGQDRKIQAALDRVSMAEKKHNLNDEMEDLDQVITDTKNGLERIQKIVELLRNFANLDAADQQQADINECLETTLAVVGHEIQDKVSVQKDLGELPFITCYPAQMNQVFMNLLLNAVQAMKTPGHIVIKTWAEGNAVLIRIADNGEGIAPEHLPNIFVPFFTTKPVGEGTGLGLAAVYGIIEKHGGSIQVESQLGEGTAFTIRLPAVQA